MNYDEALDWLYNVRRFGPNRTLEPTLHLLRLLGDPQKSFKSIHVGGSNGKGSTSAMIASILGATGAKVGLFTSPHLEEFTERIKVDDVDIPREDAARLLTEIRPLFEEMLGLTESMPLRFFDVVTAMAFLYFREKAVDYAVVEVGLGGRLDATNVVDPLVSVITNIGYEHTNILGDTLPEIAGEKAGIIKRGRPLVTATRDEDVFNVFSERARELGSEITRVGYDTEYRKVGAKMSGMTFDLSSRRTYKGLTIPLLGEHQITNASTAVAAVEALSLYGVDVPELAVREGLRSVYWPARLEVVRTSPTVVLDCAKDAEATEAVRRTLERDVDAGRIVAVVSMSSDKNIPGMIRNIAAVTERFIVTTHSVMGRAASPELIAEEITKNGRPYEVIEDEKAAFTRALELAGDEDTVLVIGSVFLAGAARSFYKQR
ncbi:bifunctional folylpolyglutamate synthase/dihydrofolate synthase [Candidatus Bathyarchaeota archaeon]|nr:bifunctional folylpolyglutamate synthase/dihydrofolate synthase [Candidatus Bathyarchaeota archaeon]